MQVDVDPDDQSNRDKPLSRKSEMNTEHNTHPVLAVWKAKSAIIARGTTVLSRLILRSRLNGFPFIDHMVFNGWMAGKRVQYPWDVSTCNRQMGLTLESAKCERTHRPIKFVFATRNIATCTNDWTGHWTIVLLPGVLRVPLVPRLKVLRVCVMTSRQAQSDNNIVHSLSFNS
jgi:hypothetical protein